MDTKVEITALKQRVKDLSSLIKVSIIINSALDLDELIQLVLEKAQTVMNAEASSVLLVNEEKNLLECKVALGVVGEQVSKTIHLKKGQGVAGWVWKNEKALIVPDVSRDERFFSQIDKASGFTTKSILAVPLMARDRIIGVAEVINRIDGKEFNKNDLELFSTFCRQVALALENVRMHQVELEQERLNQQLESARDIQQSFMPQILPGGKNSCYELSAINLPALAVGGDFYDAIELQNDKLAILIGDVSGKGVPAALLMARIMSDFRYYVQQSPNPSELVSSLNSTLVERSRRGMFVTLIYALINKQTGVCSFCNAGHLPLLHCSENGNVTKFPCEKGLPLGILNSVDFATTEIVLEKDDYLLFVTDGIVEAKAKNRQEFSINRVVKLLCKKRESTASVVENLLDQVRGFTDGLPQVDDITLMALKWNNPKKKY